MAANCFTEDQRKDWDRARQQLAKHPCKCAVCSANLYLKIRAEKCAMTADAQREPTPITTESKQGANPERGTEQEK